MSDEREFSELDWIIYELVWQNCFAAKPSGDYQLDSGFIRAHATAMDHLAKIGMIEMLGGEDQGPGRGRLAKAKEGIGYA